MKLNEKEIFINLKRLAELIGWKKGSISFKEWLGDKNGKSVNAIWGKTVKKCAKCKHIRINHICQKRYDGYKCIEKDLYEMGTGSIKCK
jgi:hypothetical protein